MTLDGCIVTADALHCHPAMAEAVQAAGADYALGLKKNHAPLYEAAVAAWAQADAKGFVPFHEETESGHDREEYRCASVIACPPDAPAFPGLVAIGRIEGERRSGTQVKTSTCYIALSTFLTPKRLFEVVRTHWSIENHLHWQLDVSFREDDVRIRKDHGPENIAFMRRMALDMLRAHPDKRSIVRKMKLASWNKAFFYGLFAYMQ